MARVTVEDCLDKVKSRFELIVVGCMRAKQIIKGSHIRVAEENDKTTVIALKEIASNEITPTEIREKELEM